MSFCHAAFFKENKYIKEIKKINKSAWNELQSGDVRFKRVALAARGCGHCCEDLRLTTLYFIFTGS